MSQLEPFSNVSDPTSPRDLITEIERAVADMDLLAHKIGMAVAGMDTKTAERSTQRPAIVRIRAHLFDFSRALARLTHLQNVDVLESERSDLQLVQSALTPRRLEALNYFRQMLRDTCAAGQLSDLSKGELVRFVTGDLGEALHALSDAIRQAGDQFVQTQDTLALTDDLTGMPNRRAFSQLSEKLAHRDTDVQAFTIMHIDIDRLKILNDTAGHHAGDAAIRHAANAILGDLIDDDFCARIGGDEFLIVMFGAPSEPDLAARAQRLIDAISTDFDLQGQSLNVGASVGIASGRVEGDRPLDATLRNSDLALYASKNDGRCTYAFYQDTMRSARDELDAMAQELVRALDQNEFVPYFQPQVEGRTGKLAGIEALIRWNHPERGLLGPYHFLEQAEAAGLLVQIDEYLTGCIFAATRRMLDMGLGIPHVSINITSHRLNTKTIVDDLIRACDTAGIPATAIGLEILESAMIEDKSKLMIDNVANLSLAGFRVELDDFGTGHASVANLRFFQVDRLKIDKSFVQDIHQHNDLSMITASIIGLAHNLRIDALGEGVEKPEERLILNALGCDHIQGYGVSPPMPEDDTIAWIQRTQRPKKRFRFTD